MSGDQLLLRVMGLLVQELPTKTQYPEYNREWLEVFDALQDYLQCHEVRWEGK